MIENNRNIYRHGIPGYGQKGSPGISGEDGKSVYYSSISDSSTMSGKIRIGKALSNNDAYDEDVEYHIGDTILSCDGTIYMISENEDKQKQALPIGTFVSDVSGNTTVTIEDASITGGDINNPYYTSAADSVFAPTYATQLYGGEEISGKNVSFNIKIDGNLIYCKTFIEMGVGIRVAEKTIDLLENNTHVELFIDPRYILFRGGTDSTNNHIIVEYVTENGEMHRIKEYINLFNL